MPCIHVMRVSLRSLAVSGNNNLFFLSVTTNGTFSQHHPGDSHFCINQQIQRLVQLT